MDNTANFPHFLTKTGKQNKTKHYEQTQMESLIILTGWDRFFSHKANFPISYYTLIAHS